MRHSLTPSPIVRELVVLARHRLTGDRPKRKAASLEVVQEALARRQRRRRVLSAIAATGVVVLVSVLGLLVPNEGEALRVQVLSGAVRLNGPEECALLRFSDGSEVTLGAGALLHITVLHPRGAELALERGSARLDLAQRPGARWGIRAGDYRMDGSGSSFDIDFDPDRHALSLDLTSGSLSVSGPAIQRDLELQAGEHLSVETDRRVVHLGRRALVARCSPRDAETE